MDTSKATARPWRALRWWESAGMTLADASDDEERAEWEQCKVVRIEDANGEAVCAAHDLAEIEQANAALIVRAVNSHEAREAALRAAENWIAEYHASMGYAADSGVDGLLSQLRAALALAEQGEG